MIVLYGEDSGGSQSGGIDPGVIEIDITTAQIEEYVNDTQHLFTVPDESTTQASFTEIDGDEIVSSIMNLKITAPGVDNIGIDSVSSTIRVRTLVEASITSDPLGKEDLVNKVFKGMGTTFSMSGDSMSAIFDGTPVSADIVSTEIDNMMIDASISSDENGIYTLSINNTGSSLNIGEMCNVESVQLTLFITKGSQSVTKDINIPYSDLLFRPKVSRSSDKFLYVVEGEYKMSGGWLEDNTQLVGKYPVFKTDIDPILSFFRNKFYEVYDPFRFEGDLSAFAFTSGKVGDLFTGLHVVARNAPVEFNDIGIAQYFSDEETGIVIWDVLEGVLKVVSNNAVTSSGYAIFEFQFKDSIYTKQYFHIPCDLSNEIPLAIAIDAKIAYDPYGTLSSIAMHSQPTLLGTKGFFSFIMSYIKSLRNSVIFKAQMWAPFAGIGRGLISALTPGSLESVFQIVMLSKHTEGIAAITGNVVKQYGNMYRSIGFIMAQVSRGLSKEQKKAVVNELRSAIDDEYLRSKAKGGSIAVQLHGSLSLQQFYYSDGLVMKITGLGACWDSDLNAMYNNPDSVANDDFKAMVIKHSALSSSDNYITIGKGTGIAYALSPYSGNVTRIKMNGHINEIGGIDDPMYRAVRKWSRSEGSNDPTTLLGNLSLHMRRSIGDRFSRYYMQRDLGQTTSEFEENPIDVGGLGRGADINYGTSCKVTTIDLDNKTVRIWARGLNGEEIPCKILKPNSDIILAMRG